MQKFGTFNPTGVGHIILTLAKLGFGRGRLKKIFAQIWNQVHGDEPVDICYHGLNFRLLPKKNTIESKMMFSARRREGAELKMISHHLGSGGVFVDIGANIGLYSIYAAKCRNIKVFAFEPSVFNLEFLFPCGLAALCQLSGTAFLMILFRLRNFAIGSTYVRTEVVVAAFIGTIFFDEFVSDKEFNSGKWPFSYRELIRYSFKLAKKFGINHKDINSVSDKDGLKYSKS